MQTDSFKIRHLIITILTMIVPFGFFLGQFMFPVYVLLERNLQLNGKKTFGNIIAYSETYAKNKDIIHNYQVSFTVNNKEYSVWIYSSPKYNLSGKMEVVYVPEFPWYAKSANRKLDQWDDNLFVRSLVVIFIAFVTGGITIGFFYRGIKA